MVSTNDESECVIDGSESTVERVVQEYEMAVKEDVEQAIVEVYGARKI